eukprot:CAMPEP_0196773718 /NCGR_PEP_ID=MMETSP1104-20130614/2941_1 /TAXON_ID=33652 /ORGANISM="Cafeteria sp., Strain Caron Lab Isolate" /LENGTH=313 /DNA_ID=CAMNT_0042143869 /DNA_START=116 /DNA_END=1054 /DNA_ORIENTATION=-
MTFGNAWGFGSDDIEECRAVFETYTSHGGNFIDTANKYQEGKAEEMLGQFMKDTNSRDDLVLATKYSLKANPRAGPNYTGNSRKNFFESLKASLRRLQTDYVDLFYLHFWDYCTPTDEVMRNFDDAVRMGYVHYAGVSDVPAWRVAEMQTMARERGYPWFIAAQYRYNLCDRTCERDVTPMCGAFDIGLTPWGVLGQGKLTGKVRRGEGYDSSDSRRASFVKEVSDREYDIIDVLLEVAAESGRTPAQVALNWTLQQPTVTSPVVGARTAEQLKSNLEALDFMLTPDQLSRLDAVSEDHHVGFPHDFIGRDRW